MKTNLGRMYAIGLLSFILFLSSMVGVPVLPGLSVKLGAPAAGVPLVVSAAMATVVIAQFFTGILADRYSVRGLVLTGALLGSVSSFLCVIATHWAQLFVFRVLGGVADAIAMPALLVLTASLAEEQPGKFFGILRSSQGLSFAVGPALGGVFSLISLRAPFLIDAVLSLAAFFAAIWLIRDAAGPVKEQRVTLVKGLKSVFSSRHIWLFLLMGIAGLFPFGILQSFIPTKAQINGLTAWQIGVILTVGAAVFSLVSYGVGSLSDRFGRRQFAVLAQLVMLAAIAALVFSGGFITLMAGYALFCVGETTTYLLCFVYATEAFDKKYIGTSMAAFDSVMDLSLFLGPLLAIGVYDVAGQLAPVFIVAGIPAVLALFVLGFRLR